MVNPCRYVCLEPLFNNLAHTDSRYFDIDLTTKSDDLSVEDLTINQIFQKLTPKPQLLLIHAFSKNKISGLQALKLSEKEAFPTFNPKITKYKVDMEFETQARNNAPKTSTDWLKRACSSIGEDKTQQLVGVFDLDKTLVSKNKECGQFKRPMVFTLASNRCDFTWYCDKKALKSIYQFQQHGHRVVVMTLGGYSFETAKRLMQTFNIELFKQDFHNVEMIPNKNKAEYLDSQIYASRAMLFDDKFENKPKKAFFTQVYTPQTFYDFAQTAL